MSAKIYSKSSGQPSILLICLLLLLPAYDGIDRAYLSAVYREDLTALIASKKELDPVISVPNDGSSNGSSDDELGVEDNLNNKNAANNDLVDESINDEIAATIANNEFNLARNRCGLNTLTPDANLEKIAIKHANYIKYVFASAKPTRFNPHYENEIVDIATVSGSNNPFFGGLDAKNRLFKAGYANLDYGMTENIAQSMYYHSAGELLLPTTATLSMAKSLLAAPYHLRSLMVPSSKVVGTGVVGYKPFATEYRTNQGYVLVTNAAATKDTRDATFSGVFTYPCQGVDGAVTGLYNETPDPVAHTGRNLSTDPIGQPVYINVPDAQRIEITNIDFYDVQRDIKLPTQLLNYQKDPYKNTEYELPANEAFILPITDELNSCENKLKKANNCGLHGNSTYRVSFDIVIDNKSRQTKSFSFSTGDVNYS